MSLIVKHRENLQTLANYLRTVYQGDFDMELFRSDCGTTACAAGHGPAAGIGVDPGPDGSWNDYTLAYFGCSVGYNSALWRWCFEAAWAFVDNTPQGAAARIERYLNGKMPSSIKMCDILLGRAPLPY